MGKRRTTGEGAIYKDVDGRWRASLELGWKDGRRQRKILSGATKAEVASKLRKHLGLQDDGLPVPRDGKGQTVEEWLWHWLDTIQPRRVREQTLMTQIGTVKNHIVPSIGRVRLRDLLPDHIEKLEAEVAEKGVSGYTVLNVHRTLSRALVVAEQRGLVARNVCRLVDPPRVTKTPVQPLNQEEARALLAAAETERNGARWIVALSLGLRQSEALGLPWTAVNFERGTLSVTQQLNRATHRHGCGRPPTCGLGPSRCPEGKGGPMSLAAPNSGAGRRVVVLPPPLLAALRRQRAQQAEERLRAGSQWPPENKAPTGYSWDLVFRSALGRPLQHGHDSLAWKALLRKAGVRDARLHDARHTAASLLLAMRVPARVVMEVLGHSKYELTMTTYSHVMPELARDAAAQMTAALWGPLGP
ncbi:MAG: integrase family protein [Frankiales bacterium]|nr:integrase family protein [Frankiales bacterium]